MLLQNKSVPVRRISNADSHMFFGYYDLCPYDSDGKYHLAHKVPFADRLQTRGDWAQLGIIELSTGKFFDLDTTEAWNFQQGAMLQWNPQKPNEEILFNIFDGHEFRGCRLNIKDGNKTTYEKPFANVSKDGKYALGINFSRLYDFRPGYGYAATGDPFFYHKHCNRDGVFLTDLETGSCKLVLTLEEIWDFSHSFFGGKDEKLIINHITFNPSGTRFLMLVRNFPAKGASHDTALITVNRDGSDMFMLSDYGVQSHYYWLDDERLIIYNDGKELDCSRGWANNYILTDRSYEGSVFADGFFYDDNHMSFSPADARKMITDTYWDANSMRRLRLCDTEADVCYEIGRFYSPHDHALVDIRCDLHPRWKQDGKRISFDSIHEGYRGIYEADLLELV